MPRVGHLERHLSRAATVALAAVLSIYMLASVWIRLAANDYCNLGYASAYGPLMGPWLYTRWTNAMTTTSVFGLVAQHQVGPTGSFTVLVLGAWLLITWATVRRLAIAPQQSFPLALLLIVAVLNTAPALGEDFYWETALFEYGLTLTLLTGVLWWLVRCPPSPRDLIWLWGTGISAFLAANGSTLSAVLFPALFAGLLLGAPVLGLDRKLPGAALLGGLLGGAITLAAPGNAVRAASYPPRNFSAAVLTALSHSIQPLFDSLTHSPAAALTLLTLPILIVGLLNLAPGNQLNVSQPPRQKAKTLAIIAILMIGACFLSEFVFAFATSTTDYRDFGRAEFFPMAVVTLGVGLLPIVSGLPIWLRSRKIFSLALVVFSLASAVNAISLISTLSLYAQAWDVRDSAIRSGVLDAAPLHLFTLSDVETGWALDCLRQYYAAPIQPQP